MPERLPAAPSSRFFRFAAFVALAGTLTTAANIALNEIVPDTAGDPLRAAALSTDVLYTSLQWTLLVHALVTLIPPMALALMRQPGLAGAALLGAVFTGMEKFTELIGQTLRIFLLNGTWRAELMAGASGARREQLLAWQDMFSAGWSSLYFVLWTCGSLAAVAFAVTFASSPHLAQRLLAIAAGLVALLGVLMTLADYFGQSWAAVAHPAVYWVTMTSYRAAIAWVLWQYATSRNAPIPRARPAPASASP
jgi:hypothetical protein